jgi:hypothetical protein
MPVSLAQLNSKIVVDGVETLFAACSRSHQSLMRPARVHKAFASVRMGAESLSLLSRFPYNKGEMLL